MKHNFQCMHILQLTELVSTVEPLDRVPSLGYTNRSDEPPVAEASRICLISI